MPTRKPSEGRSYFYLLQTKLKQQLPGTRAIVALTITNAGNCSLPTGAGWQPSKGWRGRGTGVCSPATRLQHAHPYLAWPLRDRGGQNVSIKPATLFPTRMFPPTKMNSRSLAATYRHRGHGHRLHSHVGLTGSHRVPEGTGAVECHLSAGGWCHASVHGEEFGPAHAGHE